MKIKLSESSINVLVEVIRGYVKGTAFPSGIARKLKVSQSAVSQHLDKLLKAGLIERSLRTKKQEYMPTRKGVGLMNALSNIHNEKSWRYHKLFIEFKEVYE